MTLTTLRHACDTADMRVPHGALRKGLSHPEAVISRGATDPMRSEQISAYYATVLELLHLHHTAEDVVLWPRLRERVPEEGALFDRMEQQHTAIGAATMAAQLALADYEQSPTAVHGRGLADALTALRGVLEVHLSDEEREILPLAAVNIDQEEWDQMPAHAMGHYAGGRPWLLLGLVFDQMSEEEQEKMLGMLPAPLLQMWEGDGFHQYHELMASVRPEMAN